MLLFSQNKKVIVNTDMVESVEIDYSVGNAYGIKAVFERSWNDPDTGEVVQYASKRLAIYKSSLDADEVMKSLYSSYANGADVFAFPPDTP